MLTLFASGVTWLVAWSSAVKLDDDCPNRRCVAGTTGADNLERARDARDAADVLAGIGFGTLGGGLVVIALAVGTGEKISKHSGKRSAPPTSAKLKAAPGGASLEVTF
jgi:hypothetical protein